MLNELTTSLFSAFTTAYIENKVNTISISALFCSCFIYNILNAKASYAKALKALMALYAKAFIFAFS